MTLEEQKKRLEYYQKLRDFVIDSEFESLIQPPTDEEFKQLEENVLKEGKCLDSLKVWYDQDNHCSFLIDGHNRWKILQQHPENDIDYDVDEVQLSSRDEVKEWIIDNQLGRRNLTPFQRTELALKKKPIIAERAKKNQSTHTVDGYQGLENSSKAVDTRQEIATAAQVSTDTVRKVEKILEKASDEDKEALRNGKTTVNRVFKIVSGNEKKESLHYTVQQSETNEGQIPCSTVVNHKSKQHPFDSDFIREQQEQDRKYRLVQMKNQPTTKPLVFKRSVVNNFNLHEFCSSELADTITLVAMLTGEKPGELIMRHVINNLQSDVEKLSCGIYECSGEYDKQKIDNLSKKIESLTGIKADEWIMKSERMSGESRDYALNRIGDEYLPGEIQSTL